MRTLAQTAGLGYERAKKKFHSRKILRDKLCWEEGGGEFSTLSTVLVLLCLLLYIFFPFFLHPL
jgi:hypothetical protein